MTERSGDRSGAIEAAFPLLGRLNPDWGAAVVRVWSTMWAESAWRELRDCPYNPIAPSVDLVTHVNQVTEGALALADTAESFLGLEVDREIVIAAGLLHDASKLVEYERWEGGARKSAFGEAYRHALYAAERTEAEGLPPSVVAIVRDHTPLSDAAPTDAEGLCIYYADLCAADLARSRSGAPLHLAGHGAAAR